MLGAGFLGPRWWRWWWAGDVVGDGALVLGGFRGADAGVAGLVLRGLLVVLFAARLVGKGGWSTHRPSRDGGFGVQFNEAVVVVLDGAQGLEDAVLVVCDGCQLGVEVGNARGFPAATDIVIGLQCLHDWLALGSVVIFNCSSECLHTLVRKLAGVGSRAAKQQGYKPRKPFHRCSFDFPGCQEIIESWGCRVGKKSNRSLLGRDTPPLLWQVYKPAVSLDSKCKKESSGVASF